MHCKKFVVECQENLQRVFDAVGSKTEENIKFEQLLSELINICDDNPRFNICNKSIIFARNNKFIDAAFCYRIFLQDYKFNKLREIDIFLKCVLLAENTNNINYGYEIIFKNVAELVENYFIDKGALGSLLASGHNYKDFDLYRFKHKLSFGDYLGFSVQEILEENPGYLLSCIIHVKHFALDNKILVDKRLLLSKLYGKAVVINLVKNIIIESWEAELEDEANADSDDIRSYTWEQETFDAITDGQLSDYDNFDGDIDDARKYMGLD